jgi:SAM-dependent methyltransferase
MDFQQLSGLISAHAEARIVHAAVELGVFDAIGEKHLTAVELSAALGSDTAATELLLNSLAALSLLEKANGIFALHDSAKKYLVSTSPTTLCGMIRFEAANWDCWGKLADSIRTGQPARPPNMYQDDAHETATFIEAMDSLVNARGDAEVLAQALDWHRVESLLDIGSGPATYPIHLCRRYPQLRAAIFDLPATLRVTERFVRAAAMAERIRLIAGDYRHDAIPGSYDLIFLSNIIHGENSEKNATLMAKLARHLNPGGRVVIKDHILDATRARPPVGAIFSMLMLLTTDGGRCYSFDEIKAWLEQAGLHSIREIVLPPPMTSSLVIGVK